MATYTLNGIILQNHDVGEGDVMTTAFSRERGKVRFMVRGTKKPASSLRPAVEPFTEGLFFLVKRHGADLLSEWEPEEYNFGFKRNAGKLSLASYLGKMITEFAPENMADIKLFNLLKNILFTLYTKYINDIIKLIVEWGFLTVSGLAPDFGVCAGCGRPDSARGFFWDIREGDFYCSGCAGGAGDQAVRLRSGEVMLGKSIERAARALCGTRFGSAAEVSALMGRFDLDGGASRYSATLSRSVEGFCRYHLREDVPGWHIKF
jgi:DNA repair protein RecO (recombination protein O)